MGIPRFFKYISDKFPEVHEHTSFKNGFNKNIDNLYLDANGILHNCYREIYFPKFQKEVKGNKEILLFDSICKYIDELLNFVKPAKLFYIAIDGTAPIAKLVQQRQRRYKAVDIKTDEELQIFDSTCITPGTVFMYNLSKYIKYYILKMMNEKHYWKNIEVIFSGHDVPGEGEHKIVNYIRSLKDCKSLTHCMYGLDADLFMLSLSTECPNFYLLREDQFNVSWNDTYFYVVNIEKLRKKIKENWEIDEQKDEQYIINDFIFVCFLAGNDFLHSLPGFYDLGYSINYVMDMRTRVLKNNYIVNNTRINYAYLYELFCVLEKNERKAISSQYYRKSFPNNVLNNSLIDPNKPNLGVDMKEYRKLYYQKSDIKCYDTNAINRFCMEYIKGLSWVNFYYHKTPNNWGWFYPYHYSPLLLDVIDFLKDIDPHYEPNVIKTIYNPILPFKQLLCVIPPKSKALLPYHLHYLYEDNVLKKYYPSKYNIDLEGKFKEWEGIALLPFVDINDIDKKYEEAIKLAEMKNIKTNYLRNKLGKTLLFKTPVKKYNYHSEYGKILKCNVGFEFI